MAGEFADAIARRQRSKLARLQRSADLWKRGAAGERATAKALASLPSDSWVVLHDVRWPGRPFANIDHVAIGPSGVFVIDSKNWSGSVQLDRQALRQDGRTRGRELVCAREAAAAVARLLAVLPSAQVLAVLCLVGKDVTGWAGSVLVCNTSNIAHVLTSRRSVMTPEVVRAVANELRGRLQNAPEPRRAPASPPRRRQGAAPPVAGPASRRPWWARSSSGRSPTPRRSPTASPTSSSRRSPKSRDDGPRRPARQAQEGRRRASAARGTQRAPGQALVARFPDRSARNDRSAIVRVLPAS